MQSKGTTVQVGDGDLAGRVKKTMKEIERKTKVREAEKKGREGKEEEEEERRRGWVNDGNGRLIYLHNKNQGKTDSGYQCVYSSMLVAPFPQSLALSPSLPVPSSPLGLD
jgi:hypothetical protein